MGRRGRFSCAQVRRALVPRSIHCGICGVGPPKTFEPMSLCYANDNSRIFGCAKMIAQKHGALDDVRCGSKAEKLTPSICFPVCLAKRTPTSVFMSTCRNQQTPETTPAGSAPGEGRRPSRDYEFEEGLQAMVTGHFTDPARILTGRSTRPGGTHVAACRRACASRAAALSISSRSRCCRR